MTAQGNVQSNDTSTNGTANESEPATPTDAPFPFNSPHADVILRSSDGMNFRVRKAILAEASPFFETMFSLPTGTEQSTEKTDAPDLPVVPMPEDSTAVVGLLRFCYPAGRQLQEMTLDDIVGLLPAARKYTMDRMVEYVTPLLQRFVATSSLRVYCLAIRFQLGEDLTRAAARGFLDHPIQVAYSHITELDYISGAAYARLLDYHNRCSFHVQQLFVRYYTGIDSAWDGRCWHQCKFESKTNCTYRSFENSQRVTVWFSDLMVRCRNLAKDRPSSREFSLQSTIAKALVEAGKCTFCGPRAWGDLQVFLPLLTTRIDGAISQISLDVVAEALSA
ncbi:hypothetical protein EVJ58_g10248 [Rhodofomes roseus]|uniref:BTB domain-containing protein n=1 Tax=Rhodofomes roseus TaxID=34475 RepID=A0A4Y9XQG1_9APHY|nr:hypothetical protein EVJ58_g10248 [Rhodofomes roseus]